MRKKRQHIFSSVGQIMRLFSMTSCQHLHGAVKRTVKKRCQQKCCLDVLPAFGLYLTLQALSVRFYCLPSYFSRAASTRSHLEPILQQRETTSCWIKESIVFLFYQFRRCVCCSSLHLSVVCCCEIEVERT
jgi:hypothetical protein